MRYFLTLIFILTCAIYGAAQGPAGPAVGPQPVPIQFVDSAPASCTENRLYVIRSTGVIYKRISGSCRIILNGALIFPASATQGDILYASAANTYSNLAKDANATRYLSNTGTSNNPAWAQVALATGVSGDLPFANLTQCGALTVTGVAGNATADIACIAAASDFQVLRRSGTAVGFGAVNLASSNAVTGALPAANGGTGQTTYTKGDLLVTPGSTTINKLGVGSDGQILTADAASTNGVKWATVSAGVSGSGTTNQIAKFTASGTIGDSVLQDNSTSLLGTYGVAGIQLDTGAGGATIGDVLGSGDGTIVRANDSTKAITLSTNAGTITATGATIQFVTGGGTASMPSAATGTVLLDTTVSLGTILPVDMSNGVLASTTGTVYASPGTTAGLTNGTESAVSFPITRAGTIRNLYVRTGGTAKVNTPATVVTIRKNGVDTTVTLTVTQTVTTTSSDTTHSFTVVAGDLITLSFVTTGAAAVSTSIAGVSFEID